MPLSALHLWYSLLHLPLARRVCFAKVTVAQKFFLLLKPNTQPRLTPSPDTRNRQEEASKGQRVDGLDFQNAPSMAGYFCTRFSFISGVGACRLLSCGKILSWPVTVHLVWGLAFSVCYCMNLMPTACWSRTTGWHPLGQRPLRGLLLSWSSKTASAVDPGSSPVLETQTINTLVSQGGLEAQVLCTGGDRERAECGSWSGCGRLPGGGEVPHGLLLWVELYPPPSSAIQVLTPSI